MNGGRRLGIHGPVLAAWCLGLAPPGHSAWAADPSEYLLLPTVNKGERELDWHSGIGSSGPTTRSETDSVLGFGWGVTNHWFTELAVRYRQNAGSGIGIGGIEWENIFQIREVGELPVDIGMALKVEQAHDVQNSLSVLAGPLIQKDFGNLQANFNVLMGRPLDNKGLHTTEIEYQSQLKYRYKEPFEFGVQAFGRLGSNTQSWVAYPDQIHGIGPVVLGQFKFPRERSLSYNAGFLFGATAHSSDRTLRFQIEYEF